MFDTADEAEAAFYAAFSSADIEAMKRVWSDSALTVCIHPMSAPLYGHAAIVESWTAILEKGGGRISHQILYRRQEGRLAIHGIEERLMLPQGVEARMHATHVYAHEPENGWKLLVHHASPLPVKGDKPKAERLLH
ncbi:MAG: nuclear transport factor 2 family protein [Pseudomonadota bacterium]